jgi:hypothetical protein
MGLASRRVMIRKAPLAAALVAASVTLAGCGGTKTTATGSASTASWVTHADPVKLLPKPGELKAVLKHASATNRYDQALNGATVNASFGPESSKAMRLASGAAELSLTAPSGSQLYMQLFIFKTLGGARSLASTFLRRTELGQSEQPGSGAGGEQRRASHQPYGKGNVSYRYAFREQNVLCLVELDGPRSRYTLADVLRVAGLADRHISSLLG